MTMRNQNIDPAVSKIIKFFFWGSWIWAVSIFVIWINNPILDQFGFRQTQTAISSYYIMKDGLSLSYATPVLGFPWAIPFEFPIYQTLTAALASFGIGIDSAGRIISFSFFALSFIPLRIIIKDLGMNKSEYLMASILYLTSPIYVFWSRTVMIESAALFFSLLWLCFLIRYSHRRREFWLLLSCILSGTMAVLTKATTFPAFCVVGCLFIFYASISQGKEVTSNQKLKIKAFFSTNIIAINLCIIPIILGYVWVFYSDSIKTENPYGVLLTSSALSHWNFGTFSQKISADFWGRVIVLRSVPEILGYSAFMSPFIIGAGLTLRKTSIHIIIMVCGFLVPLIVFTNLHFVHNYYQYANGIFLTSALAMAIAAVLRHVSVRIGMLLILIAVTGNISFFALNYLPLLRQDWNHNEVLKIAHQVRKFVPEDQSIIVLGHDWSSEIPYYGERRALAVAAWFPQEMVAQSLRNLDATLGGYQLGGVVLCGRVERYPESLRPLIAQFIAGRAIIATGGSCRLLSAEQRSQGSPPSPSLTVVLAEAEIRSESVPHALMPEGFFAHPPSLLVAKIDGGVTLDGAFGYVEAAWAGDVPPAVTFSIQARQSDGTMVDLLSRTLDPGMSLDIRDRHRFSIAIPGEGDVEVLFETKTLHGDNSRAWVYWGD